MSLRTVHISAIWCLVKGMYYGIRPEVLICIYGYYFIWSDPLGMEPVFLKLG